MYELVSDKSKRKVGYEICSIMKMKNIDKTTNLYELNEFR